MVTRQPTTRLDLELDLDAGIAPIVLIFRQAGIETFESCEGGTGHPFPVPTIRFHGGRGDGVCAYSVAMNHDLPMVELRRVWDILDGEITGPFWEATFSGPISPQH